LHCLAARVPPVPYILTAAIGSILTAHQLGSRPGARRSRTCCGCNAAPRRAAWPRQWPCLESNRSRDQSGQTGRAGCRGLPPAAALAPPSPAAARSDLGIGRTATWRAERRRRRRVRTDTRTAAPPAAALRAPPRAPACKAARPAARAAGDGEQQEQGLKLSLGLALMFVGWYGANIYFNMCECSPKGALILPIRQRLADWATEGPAGGSTRPRRARTEPRRPAARGLPGGAARPAGGGADAVAGARRCRRAAARSLEAAARQHTAGGAAPPTGPAAARAGVGRSQSVPARAPRNTHPCPPSRLSASLLLPTPSYEKQLLKVFPFPLTCTNIQARARRSAPRAARPRTFFFPPLDRTRLRPRPAPGSPSKRTRTASPPEQPKPPREQFAIGSVLSLVFWQTGVVPKPRVDAQTVRRRRRPRRRAVWDDVGRAPRERRGSGSGLGHAEERGSRGQGPEGGGGAGCRGPRRGREPTAAARRRGARGVGAAVSSSVP
jgi:hypothetical protein